MVDGWAGAVGEGDFGARPVGHELLCDRKVIGWWWWWLLLLLPLVMAEYVWFLWWCKVGDVESGQTLVESAIPRGMVATVIWAGWRLLYH